MALSEILAKFGFQIDSSKLDAAKAKTDSYTEGLKALAGLVAGSAILGGLKSMVGELSDSASELRRTSQTLGIGIDDLQRWNAAARYAGVSSEELAIGFKFLEKNTGEAVSKGGEAAAAFKTLGVELKDASGKVKDPSRLMGEVGLAIGGISDPTKRTDLALKLLGRSGIALIPIFNKGEKGLQSYLDRIDDLGGGLSQDAIDKLALFSRATKDWDFTVLSLKSALGSELIPKLTVLIDKSVKGVLAFKELARNSNIFTAAVVVLGGAATVAAISVYAAYLPLLAIFAAVILIVDDVITAFQGGDSALSDLIDSIAGAGAAKGLFEDINKGADGLADRLERLPTFGAKVGEVLSTVGSAITEFFVETAGPSIAAGFGAVVDWFVEGFKSVNEWILSGFRAVALGVADTVKDMFSSVGAAIIAGIVHGLAMGGDGPGDAMYELAKSMLFRFTSFFKINSPSVVMGDKTEFIPMAVVNKLKEWAPRVADTATDTFGGVLPGYTPTLRLPSVSVAQGGGDRNIRVDSSHVSTIRFEGGSAADRETVRDAFSQSGSEQNASLMSSLEGSLD